MLERLGPGLSYAPTHSKQTPSGCLMLSPKVLRLWQSYPKSLMATLAISSGLTPSLIPAEELIRAAEEELT